MTDGDYLWCALNLLLDDEEELARLCPGCRAETLAGRCPVCGAQTGGGAAGENAAFDEARFEALKRGRYEPDGGGVADGGLSGAGPGPDGA